MKLKRAASFLLAVITVLSAFCALFVYGAADGNTEGNLDFTDPDGLFNISLTPSELLCLMIGGEITDEEADYLDRYFEHSVSLTKPYDPKGITVSQDGETITITAKEYEYTASNGRTVRWIPQKAVMGESSADFSAGQPYRATLSGGLSDEISVEYSCLLTIDAQTANKLLNFAYTEALSASTLDGAEEYAQALLVWRAYIEASEKYRDDLTEYEHYLQSKAEYEAQKAKYDEYLVKLDSYNKALAEYEKYCADHQKYLSEKEAYEKAYLESAEADKKRLEYLNNLNKIRSAMTAMESIYVTPSSERTRALYLALQNPELIVMFEKYKSTLTTVYEVAESDITSLRAISDELTALLNGYNDARLASEETAFRFYCEHYAEISQKFNYLYDRMMRILTKPRLFNHICAKVELEYGTGELGQYKKWRIKNVLAHIYLICLALDDTRTADGTWSFYNDSGQMHPYFFADILDQNIIITDTNASNPIGLSWLEEPQRVTLPAIPKEPSPVSEPLSPAEVKKPVEPAAVERPTEPQKATEPTVPSAEVLSAVRRTAGLVALLEKGGISKRTELDSPAEIRVTHTITRSAPTNEPQLLLLGADGEYLGALSAQNGAYTLELTPYKAADAQYTYEFSAWSATPHTITPLPERISEDTCAYAVYEKTLRTYTVTASVNGVITQTECAYGTLPSLPENTDKGPTNDTVYAFAGWEPEPAPVTENAYYIAQYVETERLYEIRWQSLDGEAIRYSEYGKTPTPPTVRMLFYENCKRYDFLGWDRSVLPATDNAVYTARYRETVMADADSPLALTASGDGYTLVCGGDTCSVSELIRLAATEGKSVSLSFGTLTAKLDSTAVKSLYMKNTANASLIADTNGGLGITFTNPSNEVVKPDGELRITLKLEELGGTVSVKGLLDNGLNMSVLCESEKASVSFIAQANAIYTATRRYTLTLEASEGGAVLSSRSQYIAGESVSVTVYPESERYVSSIILMNNASGEETALQSLSGFTMPDFDATLKISFAQKEYTVKFIANGQVISEARYLLGDAVQIPQAPADYVADGFKYTFIGWSSPIGAVTGDVEYTARYYAIPLDELPVDDGSAWAMGIVLVEIGIPVAIVFILLTAIAVILIVNRKKLIKRKKRGK